MTQVPSADLTLPDGVQLVPGRGGLTAVQIDFPGCPGEVYLQGAHVTSWRPPGGEVLWVSKAAVFRPGRRSVAGCRSAFPGSPAAPTAPRPRPTVSPGPPSGAWSAPPPTTGGWN